MNKNTKDTKDQKKEVTTATTGVTPTTTTKLGVFEEDDYFEEFDDEEMHTDKPVKDEINFKQWQEEWEDEEINDQFEKVLRQEMEAFKKAKAGQSV